MSEVQSIIQAYQLLREHKNLPAELLQTLESSQISSYQRASLAMQLMHAKRSVVEEKILETIFAAHPKIKTLVQAADTLVFNDRQSVILFHTDSSKTIGKENIDWMIQEFTADRLDLDFFAIWLMTVCLRGLSVMDLEMLTQAMLMSGKIYDYRNLPELKSTQIVRRYPTGALSEKAALILPSMLAAAAVEFPLASPFIVARSLGYTGGTWDKLKSIPGFTFPHPGDQSIEVMRECGVAMSVTIGDFNPADRKMYQFRSATGTIECHDLISSSIASKMLALPADHLLLDVRYGSGAFIEKYEKAQKMGAEIQRLIQAGGTPCTYLLTGTEQPSGSAVGNALEVLESIAIMNSQFSEGWDPRALEEQKNTVLDFFSHMMAFSFSGSEHEWKSYGLKLLSSGKVYQHFLKILKAHKVKDSTLQLLQENPRLVIGERMQKISLKVTSSTSLNSKGKLLRINQKKLGNIINFQMGGGGNDFSGDFNPNAGVVLRKRIGDEVIFDDVICEMYSENIQSIAKLEADILSCFEF